VCECDSRARLLVRSFKYINIQCRGSGHFRSVYIYRRDETRRDGRHAHEGENPCAHCVNGDGARGRDCVATPLITRAPHPLELTPKNRGYNPEGEHGEYIYNEYIYVQCGVLYTYISRKRGPSLRTHQ